MKNTYKYFLIAVLVIIGFACEDEDRIDFKLEDTQVGAVPNFTRTANDDGFVNLLDLPSSVLEFSVDFRNDQVQSDDGGKTSPGSGLLDPSTEYSDVSSIDIMVMWTDISTGLRSAGNLDQGVTTWPSTFNYDVDDLIAAIPDLSAQADLELGDVFQFAVSVSFADGRFAPGFVNSVDGLPVVTYVANFANIPGTFTNITYNVACPSEIPGGDYTGVVVDGFGVGGNTAVVTVTPLGAGNYGVSDISAGLLGILIGDPTYLGGGTFSDVCNIITVPTFNPPGLVAVSQASTNGSYDPNTGVIVINWSIVGVENTTTLTPL